MTARSDASAVFFRATTKDYERDYLGKREFAFPDHPLHGEPRDGRPKGDT